MRLACFLCILLPFNVLGQPSGIGHYSQNGAWFTNSFASGFNQWWAYSSAWSISTTNAICTPTLEDELIVNGSFTDPVTEWQADAGWSFSGGLAVDAGTGVATLYQTNTFRWSWLLAGFNHVSRTAGNVYLYAGNAIGKAYTTSIGIHTETRRHDYTIQRLGLYGSASYGGSDDDVTFKRLVASSLFRLAFTPSSNMVASVKISAMTASRQAGMVLRGKNTYNIFPLGDSKTAGVVTASWPYAIGSPFTEHTIRQTGTGYTIAALKADIDAVLAVRYEIPNFCLFNIGVNDHAKTDADTNQMTTDLVYILDAIHTKWPSAHCYLSHVWGRTYPCVSANSSIDQAISARSSFAYAGPDERVWLENGDDGATYTTDGVHYNAAGIAKAGTLWHSIISTSGVTPIGAPDGILVYYDGVAGGVKAATILNGAYAEVITGSVTFVSDADLVASINGTDLDVTYNGAAVGVTTTVNNATINGNTGTGLFSTDSGNTFSIFSIAAP